MSFIVNVILYSREERLVPIAQFGSSNTFLVYFAVVKIGVASACGACSDLPYVNDKWQIWQ